MVEQGDSHFHSHFSSTVGLLITAIFPLTMSMTLHGPDAFPDPAGFPLAQKVAKSSFVCATSHFARSQIFRFSHPSHWSKVEITRLGVDTAAYAPRGQRCEPGVFELICVGRLAPVKGQSLLLQAVSGLLQEGYKV